MSTPAPRIRRLALPLVLIGVGIFALVVLQWKLDLGSFAESPQLIEVPWGARAIVGGGLAGLDFDRLDGETATLRLWCAAAETTLRLEPGEVADACGVRVRLLGFLEGREGEAARAALEVSWENGESSEALH